MRQPRFSFARSSFVKFVIAIFTRVGFPLRLFFAATRKNVYLFFFSAVCDRSRYHRADNRPDYQITVSHKYNLGNRRLVGVFAVCGRCYILCYFSSDCSALGDCSTGFEQTIFTMNTISITIAIANNA